NLARPEEVALGDLAPRGARDAAFQLSLSKQYQGPQDLPIFAKLSEKRALFSKAAQRLPLRLGARLAALRAVSAGSPRQPPRLEYDVSAQDGGRRGVFESGQELALKVRVKNSGAGAARGVAVALSGSKGLVELLGSGRAAGDIAPGQEQTVVFQGVLPNVLPDKASLDVRVSEMQGYAPAAVKRLSFSFKSAPPAVLKVVDVDMVPSGSFRAPQRLAVVIGVGKHRDGGISPLPNARHDAEVVARYLERAGGLSQSRIRLLLDENALRTDFQSAFETWLPLQVKAAGAGAEVIIYYAGHGAPDPETGDYQLVPFEGSADYREGLYPLSAVTAALRKAQAKASVLMLDACFAGGGRSLSASDRPLIPARKLALPPGTVLLAASSGSQTSHEKKDSNHGLFTYYLLAGLQGEADARRSGRVRVGELAGYVKKMVPAAAAEELGAAQEPEVRPEPLGAMSETVLTGY
ncbi:MAG: caspase family protein, partial [Elusimicrobia bacterium]|nr:caspase family protein [Elusimicrobiota bacterium]